MAEPLTLFQLSLRSEPYTHPNHCSHPGIHRNWSGIQQSPKTHTLTRSRVIPYHTHRDTDRQMDRHTNTYTHTHIFTETDKKLGNPQNLTYTDQV